MIQIQRPSFLDESKEIILVLVISLEADIRNINMVRCDSYLMLLAFRTSTCLIKGCRIGRCSLICQVLCRIDDIRYVSRKNYLIIFLICNLHRFKLNLISSKRFQFCQSGISSECLSELVFIQINWQHDGVPFIDILIERFLVEMENHIVISL